MGLESQRLKMPAQLSGGQQQRVALARAMITRPDVILFDEPLSNLDAKLRESVRFEIKELQRQYHLTSIYVTHDQAEALAMSDKIVVLNAGNVEQIGAPEEIYYRPTSRFVADFIGAANIDTAHITAAEQPGSWRVRCAMGEFYVHSTTPPRAEHCYICWRPEDVQFVGPHQSGDNHFTLTLEKMAFMGNLTEAWGHNDAGLSVRLQLIKTSGGTWRAGVFPPAGERYSLFGAGIMKSWRNDLLAWSLMLSGLGTILLLMGSTFYVVVVQSLGYFNLEGESHFSLEFWRDMLQDEVLHSALFYSVKVSVLGAFGSVIFAYPLALWLRKPLIAKEGIIAVLRAPMFIPGMVAAFLFVNIIAYHGVINELLMALGVINEPLRMQNDDFGWGVVILQVWKNLPFALILVGGAVNAIRNDVLDAASNLGANRLRSFTGIVVPLTLPAVQVTLILVFIGALGDFAFFSVAGPRNTYSLARLMQATAMEYGEWNNAAVIAVIIMTTAAIFTLLIATLITPFATRKGDVK